MNPYRHLSFLAVVLHAFVAGVAGARSLSPAWVEGSWAGEGAGELYAGRPEMEMWVSFVPVHLKPGVYWLDMRVVGPENCLQLVHDRGGQLSPFWVNYSDLGGLRPGREVFFADYDVEFALLGRQGSSGFAGCNGDSVIDSRDFVCYVNLWTRDE